MESLIHFIIRISRVDKCTIGSTITDWTSELDWRTDIFSLYKPGNTILSV